VRTAPNRSWTQNFNAVIIGASYVIVVSHFVTCWYGIIIAIVVLSAGRVPGLLLESQNCGEEKITAHFEES
jgi:hypothetical protein